MTVAAEATAGRVAARAGRRLAVETLFEADFGQRTAAAILTRRIEAGGIDPAPQAVARAIVETVLRYRGELDARIAEVAPAYPVDQLGRIDRALLRCAIGEMLHSAAPTRVVIAEWVALARLYSGEPARRLVNGVLGRIARDMDTGRSGGRREGRSAPGGRRR